jgi:hypothetical protein
MEKIRFAKKSFSFWKVFTNKSTYTGCQNKFVFKTLRKNVISSLKGFVWKAWDFCYFTFWYMNIKRYHHNFIHHCEFLSPSINTEHNQMTFYVSTINDCWGLSVRCLKTRLFSLRSRIFSSLFVDAFYWWVRFQAGRRSYSSTVRFPSSTSLMFP